MPRDRSFLGTAISRPLFIAICFMIATGCGQDDAAGRAAVLATPLARGAIGTWRATFWLDPRSTLGALIPDSTSVSGEIVLAEDSRGAISAAELQASTHDGVYDVDFSPFGFSSRESGALPGVIARVVPASDSLYVVLSPGTPLFAVRMMGVISGDTAAGTWTASGNRVSGGSGRFVMRRVPSR